MRVRVEFVYDAVPVVVEAPTFTLGRVKACDIRVEHPLVSRQHCRFETDDEGLTVIDLGSSNGTYVGDERIERRRLKAGDGVRIGLGGPELVLLRLTVEERTVLTIDPEEMRSTMLPGSPSAAIGGPARISVSGTHSQPRPPAPTPPPAAPPAARAAPAPPTSAPGVLPAPDDAPTEGPRDDRAQDDRPVSMIVIAVRGKERTVQRSAALLGRDDECDIVFTDGVVSRRHCELVVGRRGALVRDLGSRGGTWVDGRRVRGEASIGIGSALQLGEDGPTIRLVRAEAAGRALPGPTPQQGDGARSPLISSGGYARDDVAPPAARPPASSTPPAGPRRFGCLGRAAVLLALFAFATALTAAL